MNKPRWFTHSGIALLLLPGPLPPPPRQEPAPQALHVYPADVSLLSSRAEQTFVVQAAYPDGITRDVTAKAKANLANPALAKLEKNVLTPLVDGETQLVVEYAGKKATVP